MARSLRDDGLSTLNRNPAFTRQTSPPMDPFPKPTRRRKWLRWLALPAAAAILVLAYQLTRPPELVWWRSDELRGTGHRIKLLSRNCWNLTSTEYVEGPENFWARTYRIDVEDKRPWFLRRLFPIHISTAPVVVRVGGSAQAVDILASMFQPSVPPPVKSA